MSQVHLLYRLQQLDSEINEKKQQLREVLHAQKQNQEVLAAEKREAQTRETLQEWRSQQKGLELELASVNDKSRRSEQRLYSGNVKNPKELADLQHEIEALGRRRSALEDEILEAMLMVEEASEEHATAATEVERLTVQWEGRYSALQSQEHDLAVRLNELLPAREEQARRISPDLMRSYQAIAKRRAGVAVALLKGGICQGCGVSAPAQVTRDVNEGKLIHCANCDRILAAA